MSTKHSFCHSNLILIPWFRVAKPKGLDFELHECCMNQLLLIVRVYIYYTPFPACTYGFLYDVNINFTSMITSPTLLDQCLGDLQELQDLKG